MAGNSMEDLLSLVNQALAARVQASARSTALEALLIDKGVVTKAEIDTRAQQVDSDTKRFSGCLLTFGEKNEA
jgi:hypothetical protein